MMNLTPDRVLNFRGLNTPFYYYDMDLLRATLQAVCVEVTKNPRYEVHYAVKANSNPGVLACIAQAGLGADCVSGGEIQAAIDAGFPTHRIVFAGVGKADWEIDLALQHDIACFNVESLPELEVIGERAALVGKKARIAFRVNPNVGAHTHAHITTGLAENKFGIGIELLPHAVKRVKAMASVDWVGLHFHIGSQITDMGDFEALCHRINVLQDELEAMGIHLPSINVGGGLGINYSHPDEGLIPDFQAYFSTYATHLKLREEQTLHFELGRSLVGQCGSLISKVLYIKQGTNKEFAILDAGMTDLIRPALYQASHRIEALTSAEGTATYDVVGPICESSDIFAKSLTLPCLRRGDLVAFRSAGAYGEVMASTYNCRSLPKAYLSDEWK